MLEPDQPVPDGAVVRAPWGGYERGTREYRMVLLALVFAGFATFAQLYAPQGILPLIARDMNVTAATAALTVSASTAGLALSVLPWSWASDRLGRTRAMMIALGVAALVGLVTPFAPTMHVLVGLRVMEGIALGGVPGLAVAYLSEEVSKRHVAVAASMFVAGNSVGGLSGRILAAPVAEWAGWRAGLMAVSVLCAVTALTFALIVPRSHQEPRGREATLRQFAGSVRGHLADPGMRVLYAQGMLLMGAFVTIYNYLAFRLEAPPYLLPTSVTALLFLAYLSGTVSSRVAGGLVARFGRRNVLTVSALAMVVGALITLAEPLPWILVGLLLLTMGFFAGHAIANGWVGYRAVSGKAQATSLYNLFYYVGSSVFGWVGGLLWLAGGWWAVAALVTALAGTAAVLARFRAPVPLLAASRSQSGPIGQPALTSQPVATQS